MRVQATQKMVQELNKRSLQNYCIDFFQLLKLTPEQYAHYFIDNILDHMNDYHAETGRMNVIEVIYKPEMYALPHYITTNDLLREYRPGDTAERFFARVINSVLI